MSARRSSTLLAAVVAAGVGLLPVATGIAGAQPGPADTTAVAPTTSSSPTTTTPPVTTTTDPTTTSAEVPAEAPAEVPAADAAPVAAEAQAAAAWPDSPVYAKWQQLGGESFAGALVGSEVVQGNGIRYAKFARNVVITWQSGIGAYWFSGAVAAVWQQVVNNNGGVADNVAIMDQTPIWRGTQGGAASAFSSGYSVYYSDLYGAFPIAGAMRDKYWQYGSITGSFGWITSWPQALAGTGGVKQDFSQAVSLYQAPGAPAFWISGALRDRYQAEGAQGGRFGWLRADQEAGPNNGWIAKTASYDDIYWSAGTGAKWLGGRIQVKYLEQGGPGGHMGYPATDPTAIGVGGEYADFTNAVTITLAGSARSAFWISGALRDRWRAEGGATGRLGFPTSDQLPTSGRNGLYVLIGGAAILWGPGTGAHLVEGRFLAELRAGGDVAAYGLPQIDAGTAGGYPFQQFEDASIFLVGDQAFTIGWDFRATWWHTGGLSGFLGMAVADVEQLEPNVFRQRFQGGYILCDYNTLTCYYGPYTAGASAASAAPDLAEARRSGQRLHP